MKVEKACLFKVRVLINGISWKNNDIPQAYKTRREKGESCQVSMRQLEREVFSISSAVDVLDQRHIGEPATKSSA